MAITLIAPVCTCCPEPAELLPRDDLPGGLAACPNSGDLYHPEGTGYAPTTLPALPPQSHSVPSVHIDLSRSGYA